MDFIVIGSLAIALLLICLLWWHPRMVELRLLRLVGQLDLQVDVDPAGVESACNRICGKIHRMSRTQSTNESPHFDELRKLGRNGTTAYAWSQVLLAVIEHRTGRHFSAQARIRAIRKQYASDPECRRWLLKYYLRIAHVSDSSIQVFVDALTNDVESLDSGTRESIEAKLRQGCQIRSGMNEADLRQQIRLAKVIGQALADQTWPLIEEGYGWFRLGAFQRAENTLRDVISRAPDCVSGHILLARVLHARGEKEAAEKILEDIGNRAGGDARTVFEIASCLITIHRPDRASQLLQKAAEADPKLSADISVLKARISLSKNNVEDAIKHLNAARASGGDPPQMGLLLAECESRRGKHDRAIEVLEECQSKDDPEFLSAMANALVNAKRYEQASVWFSDAAQTTYRSREAALLRVYCLIKCGKYDEALDALEQFSAAGASNDSQMAEKYFYHGVIVYLSGSPATALPHFERALRLAVQAKNKSLAGVAAANRVACYAHIAGDRIKEGEYEQASRAFAALLRCITPSHQYYQTVKLCIAACSVRAATKKLEAGNHEAAIQMDKDALKLYEEMGDQFLRDRRCLVARLILGGTYFATERYVEALAQYERILEVLPKDEAAQFAAALCRSRIRSGDRQAPILEEIAAEKGAYAIRASLIVADSLASSRRFAEASELLLQVVSEKAFRKNPFFGEACCKVVLHALRGGNVAHARDLAVKHLAAGRSDQADSVIGALLAHDGDFVESLPFLETAVPLTDRGTLGTQLLKGVYRRIANEYCISHNFAGAKQVLQRARKRSIDSSLDQLYRLTEMADGAKDDVLNDSALAALKALIPAQGGADPAVLRAAVVSHQRYAHQVNSSGDTGRAMKYWLWSQDVWLKRVCGDRQFWRMFIDTYNEGKQYLVDCSEAELERRIVNVMAGIWLRYMTAALKGSISANGKRSGVPQYDEAKFLWERVCELVGEDQARTSFDAQVEVQRLLQRFSEAGNRDEVRKLCKWLYRVVEQKQEYRTIASNLAFELCAEQLQRGNVDEFRSLLDEAADGQYELRELAAKVRRLNANIVRHIVQKYNSDPIANAIRAVNPAKHQQGLLQVLVLFAGAQDQFPFFTNNHVDLLMPKVMPMVVQALAAA